MQEFIQISLGGKISSHILSQIIIASSGLHHAISNIFSKIFKSGFTTHTSKENNG
jgi:hypothetical protein